MKKIGVISDSHIPRYVDRLPEKVIEIFRGVDLILHAGDAISYEAIEALEEIAPVKAVSGNMDTFRNEGLLPDKLIVCVEDCRIGLIHGWGGPEDLIERVMKSFAGEELQAIVFGHSHNAHNEMRGGLLLFNPGSPTDTRFAKYKSLGLMTVDGAAVSGEIIQL